MPDQRRRRYAAGTTVTPERSRAEIEHELARRGATAFGYNTDLATRRAVIAFTLNGLPVAIALELPDRSEFKDYKAGNGARVSGQKVYDDEVRRRWRALALVIKAKLVAVDDKVTTLEREFLADVVLRDGMTMLEHVRGEIEGARRALEGRR